MKEPVWRDRHRMVFESTLREFNLQTTVIQPGAPLDYPTMISRYITLPDEKRVFDEFYHLGVSRGVLKKVHESLEQYGMYAILYCFFHESGRKSRVEQLHRIIDGLVLATGEKMGYRHICTWVTNQYPSATDAVRLARAYICQEEEDYDEEEG